MRWDQMRRLVLFLLGVALILNAVITAKPPRGEVVAGLVLVGIVPIDELLGRWPR